MKRLLIVGLLVCVFISSPSHGQQVDSTFIHLAESFYEKFAKKINNRSVVVGIYYQGADTILSYGRINMLGRKADEHDLYQIGSLTKTFTGLLFADAVVEGTLNLDDSLSQFLTIKKADKFHLTSLKQLATHTSGMVNNSITFHAIPYLSYIPLSLSKRWLLESINSPNIWIDLPWQIAIIPPPIPYFSTYGRSWVNFDLNLYGINEKMKGNFKYSNLGMGLLGRVVAENRNMSYEVMLQDKICSTLQLTSTSTNPSSELKKNYATPHNLLGLRVLRTKFRKGGIEGAGGIKSTGKDLMKYLKLQLDPASYPELQEAVELQQETYFVDEDPKRKGLKMGLAWIKYDPNNDSSNTIIWHNGQVSGSSSFMGFIPEKEIGIFVLSNNPRSNKITKEGFRVLNRMNALLEEE